LLGSPLAPLAGAIIGGATFGDFIAPISDTTITSALSQNTKIGPTVRSRIKYMAPVVLFAIIAYSISGQFSPINTFAEGQSLVGDPRGLPMLLVPAYIIYLFLKGKHLMHGLLLGLLFGVLLALLVGLLTPAQVLSLDLDNFTAKSFIIDGINRAVGISFFTILLMGLVASLKASGLIERLVHFAEERSHSKTQGEAWIAGVVSAAVLLTTHSIVAILMVADFAQKTGSARDIGSLRRANILSMVVCVFPFLLPYFIPVILMANTTNTGADFNIPTVSPLQVGLYNFVAWGLGIMVLIAIIFGYGRKKDADTN
jgi:Na+/H+ antiporter NhaC